ncbi:MAG: peptidase S8 [Cyanobacteria bacterium QH_8_48_120]|jgi:serine protease|nr:MAG: peptidase S8 [Cyanobacteria bacterium QH_1_48_107]PSO62259.1 MAG: peptidase S8 [Cyanobacteria bacterium QH_6_48_35]PSO76554.1 MAG: peptidase S8 [Cyanobacteria bacterium QH_8_48_120]PSO84296.1 MAG: peptidase S8 [Cyanobacteria bacterium QH_9_48_43]PSP29510.1 MAG: peptidase S8 [Cyanobacteria bacterium SW_4_48_29]PSP35146.1 MAG: peptidase S8 [Cyanobacteria bacterium QS_8_48_54]
MRKLVLLSLVVLGLGLALFNFKGLANQGEFDSIVLDFREDIPAAEISEELEAIAGQYNIEPRLNSEFSTSDHVYTLRGDRQLLRALKKSGLKQETEFIEPNYIYQQLEVPNDPDYAKQWNLRSINLEQAWDDTKGSGITVAVIDTGITQVPDLKQTKFVKGYNFVNDGIDATDDVGHGTHVAGTIAQSTNNNYGVAGIAYEANLMPIKVLGAGGGGTVADIAEAIRFAANHDADVINMSLGGAGESKLMKEAIDYANNKGVVVIAAAGNANRNAAAYPARYPRVIGVSALDPADGKAPYSNFGAGVDISAPGGSQAGKILQNTINSPTKQPTFAGYQGTSMAAPHVAGVAALVKSAGISEPEEVLKVLKQSVRKVAEDPLNHFGAGHLNATGAVKLAMRGQISFRDFFRWVRDNGYLNPRFWIDGGVVTLPLKLAMVVGGYILAWLLRNYFPFGWSWSLASGVIAGSSGLFFLRGIYIFDLPQWPFRAMGSSIPELGNAVAGTTSLNPIFASALIPIVLVALLLGHPQWKWFAVGSALGVAACLGVNAVVSPAVSGLGSGAVARLFLVTNAFLCFGLAYLASKGEKQAA